MTLFKTFFGNKKTNDWALDMCPSVFFSKISLQKNDESNSKIIENKSGKWKISTIFLYLLLYYS